MSQNFFLIIFFPKEEETVTCSYIPILKITYFLTKSLCSPSPLLSTPMVELAALAESLMITTLLVNTGSIVQVLIQSTDLLFLSKHIFITIQYKQELFAIFRIHPLDIDLIYNLNTNSNNRNAFLNKNKCIYFPNVLNKTLYKKPS